MTIYYYTCLNCFRVNERKILIPVNLRTRARCDHCGKRGLSLDEVIER
jgi:DNA-directed RNA polymerase subunit RPC12/RpoP